jgi:hypothetical protein
MYDFYFYCAILIRLKLFDELPLDFRNFILQNGKIRSEVICHKIALPIEKKEEIFEEEESLYLKKKAEDATKRKEFVNEVSFVIKVLKSGSN